MSRSAPLLVLQARKEVVGQSAVKDERLKQEERTVP